MLTTLIAFSALVTAGPIPQTMGGPYDYKSGGTACQGYLAYDMSKQGKMPGVLIVHDWDSINDHEMEVAGKLAKMGYVALVADIYGKSVRPKTPNESGAQAGKYKNDRVLFRERLMGALEELRKQPNVDSTRIAAIGYCFGGTGVLELARMGADLKGVVCFHGSLDAAAGMKAGPVIPKVLVLHGDVDPFAPKSQVTELEKEFRDAAASIEAVLYPGAVHSFTIKSAGSDTTTGAAYDKAADEQSWAKMKSFLAAVLK